MSAERYYKKPNRRNRASPWNTSDKVTKDISAGLEKFMAFVSSDVARAGAQAMAQVVYDAARANVPVSKRAHIFKSKSGTYTYEPGSLQRAIYQAYSEKNSNAHQQTYHISWRHSLSTKSKLPSVPYGFMVEFRKPFLYPAFADNKDKLAAVAIAAMQKTMKDLYGY